MKDESKKVEGFTVYLLKHEGRSCDGVAGFSSKVDQVTLLPSSDYPNVPQMYEPRADTPAVAIVRRHVCGRDYLTAYPVVDGEIDTNRMASGVYLWSCDARFRAICDYPVPLHDRKE